MTPEIAASLGVSTPHGALVTPGRPRLAGGPRGAAVGDLILKAGGRDVGDPAALEYRLAVAGIGNEVALEVWRDGVTMALSVAAEAEPELDESDLTVLGGNSPLTGAVVADLTAIAGRPPGHPKGRRRAPSSSTSSRARRRRASASGRATSW